MLVTVMTIFIPGSLPVSWGMISLGVHIVAFVAMLYFARWSSLRIGLYIAGAMLPIVAIILIFLAPNISEYVNHTSFESTAWKQAGEDWDNPVRLRMVDDLLDEHELKGMSKERIIELLGEPPETEYFREYDFVYWLGPERGFIRIDSEWLVIKFENDVVTKVEIVRD